MAQLSYREAVKAGIAQEMRRDESVVFIGEDVASGVKQDGGTISKQLNELEIKCLPADLPEYIEVDVSHLRLDQTIHISAVTLPKGVELATAIEDDAHDHAVVSITMPKVATTTTTEEATADQVPSAQKDGAG